MVQPSKIFLVIKRYLINCNLHGIRYLVDDGFHWTERLFWLVTCALCWFDCTLMVKDSLDGFYTRPVAFTAESTYLDWDTNFPSISVCMRGDPVAMGLAMSIYKKKYGIQTKSPNAWAWLFAATNIKGNSKTAALFSSLTADDVVDIYKESIPKCSTIMSECIWRSYLRFNCCDEFLPLRTAAGICYVFNSRHTRADAFLKRFTMNQNTGVGYLAIGLTAHAFFNGDQPTILVSINDNLAIPTVVDNNGKEIDIAPSKMNVVYFALEDTFNEPGVKNVPPERRKCRFPDETENFHSYERYSNSGCLIQLQMENMLRYCGCVSHLFPYPAESPVCNFTGVVCLTKNHEAIMAKEDLGKHCLPDCEGAVMRYYQNIKEMQINSSQSEISQGIKFELLALPTSRYKRYVVRSLLDLVVAVGSTAGLFMGAGILSLVEIPYWLLLRHES